MPTTKPNNRSIVGVDVSKDKLDTYFLENTKIDCFENNQHGFKQFVNILKQIKFSGLLVLEATGGYEKLCHRYLDKAGFSVHIAHPKRVHHFIKQKGYFCKTDKIDAKAIAEYGDQECLEPTVLKDKAAQERQDLSSRGSQLIALLIAEKCCLKDHLSTSVKRSVKRIVKQLEKEIAYIEELLRKSIASSEELQKKAEHLGTFKGVGPKTIAVLLSTLPELGYLNRSEIACLCGLAPRNRDSGRKTGKRSVSGGRPHIRKILYMASLSAIRHNPEMKAVYDRLKQKGKASKVCLTAVMRKIIITLNAMLRDNKPWQGARQLSV
jgi:transposase